MNADTLTTLYSHNLWANIKLFECCAGLSDEQLDSTIIGTFGTIRDTLQHIVGAERIERLLQGTEYARGHLERTAHVSDHALGNRP